MAPKNAPRNTLILRGVRQNNLKSIDLELPLGRSIVVTGPSGSGKSSLAFETIHAEGQRRFMQSLSTYARQFLDRFKAPLADKIENIPPTIALEQANPVRNSRATVGTTTEIYDYLRLIFEKLGVEYCEKCDRPMERWSLGEAADKLLADCREKTLLVTSNHALPKDPAVRELLLQEWMRAGFSRVLTGPEAKATVVTIEDLLAQKKALPKEVQLIHDRIRVPKEAVDDDRRRIQEALGQGVQLSGLAVLWTEQGEHWEKIWDYTTKSRCPGCGAVQEPRTATTFSFNNPLGACVRCKGFGNTLEIDPALVLPNTMLSLAQGAVEPFTKPSLRKWQKKLMKFCDEQRIDGTLPYKELGEKDRTKIYEGGKGFPGVKGVFEELAEEKYKLRIRVFLSRYQSPVPCADCGGGRLNRDALRVKVGGKNIAEVSELTLENLGAFLRALSLKPVQREMVKDPLAQLFRRIECLDKIGLGYLTLARLTRTLSGGEYQRILLGTQLSQGLTGTLYVLDEPSIGLHPKDTAALLAVMQQLRDLGNTLVVVEHDPEVIEWAEHVVDMGPGSGNRGGEVVFAGSQTAFLKTATPTSKVIKQWRELCANTAVPALPKDLPWLEVRGAAGNNLRNVNMKFPLQAFVAVTGVSGSGKSTLVVDTIYQALAKMFQGRAEKIARFQSIRGFENLQRVELIDQSPIGRSSRSNPVTFFKAFDEIRQLLAETKDAMDRRLTPGHFSFNVAGGRCETCEGEGRVRIDMVFLEDVFVPCEACGGKRFKPEVLAVRYKGKNIDDILNFTIDEAYEFFASLTSLRGKLSLLREVGLGYLRLGQPGFTLSGGEAQRLKIAKELSQSIGRSQATLFILDEPTTGLHFQEVEKLIGILRRLVQQGHSVLVIEHNLQLICAAQYLVDLGPDGGERGGTLTASGTPREVALEGKGHTAKSLRAIFGAAGAASPTVDTRVETRT